MSYSENRCFGKQDVEQAREWMYSEFGAEGEALYRTFEQEINDRDMVCSEEIREWSRYLQKKFTEEELQDLIVVESRSLNQIYESVV